MVFAPEDFYNIAMKVYSEPIAGLENASYRTVVGRVYYSLFLTIKKYLLNKGKWEEVKRFHVSSYRDAGIHERLIEYLKVYQDDRVDIPSIKVLHLANYLSTLKTLRVNADYELLFNSDATMAKSSSD